MSELNWLVQRRLRQTDSLLRYVKKKIQTEIIIGRCEEWSVSWLLRNRFYWLQGKLSLPEKSIYFCLNFDMTCQSGTLQIKSKDSLAAKRF